MLTNFSACLALIAGVASASFGHGHGHHQPSYGHHQPSYGHQQPQYAPRPSHNQHHHHSGQSHQHAYANAWGQQALSTDDTSGWWSPYQQYRPAIIAYKPAPIHEPVFAICEEMVDVKETGITGDIKFAQVKGHPVQVKVDFNDLRDSVNYWFRINETGLVGIDCLGFLEDEEFNPMYAIDKYGNGFTHQDPWRGRIDPCTTGTTSCEQDQNHLYQNLSGKDSIIGRSISMFEVGDTDPFTDTADDLIGCCVIARDAKPDERPETNVHHAYPVPHPKPQHHKQVNKYQAPKPQPVTHYQPKPAPKPQPVTHYQPKPEPEPKPVSHYHQPQPEPKAEPVNHYQPVSHYSHYQPKPQPINHYPVSHYQQPRPRPVYRPLPTYNTYRPAGRNGFSNQYSQYPYAW